MKQYCGRKIVHSCLQRLQNKFSNAALCSPVLALARKLLLSGLARRLGFQTLPTVFPCLGGGPTSFVVQSLSCVQLFVTPQTAAHRASLSFTISWSLLKFMFTELVMPSSHLILCYPLLLLPSIFSSIRVFSNGVGSSYQVAKDWSFSFSPPACYWGHKTKARRPSALLSLPHTPPGFPLSSLHLLQDSVLLHPVPDSFSPSSPRRLPSLPFLRKFHLSQPTDMPIGTPVSLLQKPFSPSALPLKALTSIARPLTRVSTALTHL